jgi:hypothetical protein
LEQERKDRFTPSAASTATLPTADPNPNGNGNNLSSKSPVVMPPPILKKSRGPSTTGPRPTARFISPHESENEAEINSSAGSNVVVQAPSPGSKNAKFEKKSTVAAKKKAGFVAAGAAKKKRPVYVRRQNSQSSADSVKTNDSPKIPSSQGSAQSSLGRSPLGRSPPLMPAPGPSRGNQQATSKFQEQFSPDPPVTSAPRQQSESRKDTKGSKTSTPKSQASKSRERKPEVKSPRPLEKQSSRNVPREQRTSQPTQSVISPTTAEEYEVLSLEGSTRQNTELNRRPTDDRSRNQFLQRSSSGMGYDALGIMHHDRKSSASLASTLTPATGQLQLGDAAIDFEGEPSPKRPTAKDKGKGRAEGEYKRDDFFTKRPVQPVAMAAPSEPVASLARSKSQLTLLLEKDQKDRAKNGVNKPNGKRR